MPTLQELIQLLETRNQTIAERESRIIELEAELDKKQQEIDILKRALYGRKSEKTKVPEASSLPLFPDFDPGIEVIDNTSLNVKPDEVIDAIEEETRQRREREKAKKKNRQKKERRIAAQGECPWMGTYPPNQKILTKRYIKNKKVLPLHHGKENFNIRL